MIVKDYKTLFVSKRIIVTPLRVTVSYHFLFVTGVTQIIKHETGILSKGLCFQLERLFNQWILFVTE